MPGFDEAQHPRDPDGKFTAGEQLSLWAKERTPKGFARARGEEGKLKAPSKEELKKGARRYWSSEPVLKSLPKETWMGHYTANPDKGGKVLPERLQSVQAPIIHHDVDAVSAPKPGEQKMAIFTMGGPASGKSSMLKELKGNFVHIDPDEVRVQLPEYKQVTSGPMTYRFAAAMSHEEASDISKRELDEAVKQGKHIIMDGTGAKAESIIAKMDKLRAAGYHIHLAYAHLGDPEEGVKRVASRAEASGRYVPEEVVRDAYSKIPKNFEAISKHADTFAVHDTSKEGSPVAWKKGEDGKEQDVIPGFASSFREKYFAKPSEQPSRPSLPQKQASS